jgi:hypothetical protein
MADYSRQLFEMFAAPGEAIQGNRDRAEAKRQFEQNFARQTRNDDWRMQTDQRDFDRGVVTSDRSFGRGMFENDRSYGLQERNFNRGAYESDRNYELAREQAARKDVPRIDTFYEPGTGREVKGVYDQSAPGGFRPVGGAKAAVAPRGQAMTAVDKKAILDADEGVQAGQNVISALGRAAELSSQANAGWGAGARAAIGNNLPDWLVPDRISSPASSAATSELDNTVTAQALDQLKATFGGMPTEGERKILLDIQGSVNQPPAVREAIWKRAKVAAEKRVAFNKATASAIRSGDYFTEGGGQPAPQQGNLAPGVEDGGYIFRGGDPSDPNSWEPAQ